MDQQPSTKPLSVQQLFKLRPRVPLACQCRRSRCSSSQEPLTNELSASSETTGVLQTAQSVHSPTCYRPADGPTAQHEASQRAATLQPAARVPLACQCKRNPCSSAHKPLTIELSASSEANRIFTDCSIGSLTNLLTFSGWTNSPARRLSTWGNSSTCCPCATGLPVQTKSLFLSSQTTHQ